jgi:hypothetical protein
MHARHVSYEGDVSKPRCAAPKGKTAEEGRLVNSSTRFSAGTCAKRQVNSCACRENHLCATRCVSATVCKTHIPARGPLKKTLPWMMFLADLAMMKKDDCFSYSPTSRAVQLVTVVNRGCSPSVPSIPA